jgi:hypothetical protein
MEQMSQTEIQYIWNCPSKTPCITNILVKTLKREREREREREENKGKSKVSIAVNNS